MPCLMGFDKNKLDVKNLAMLAGFFDCQANSNNLILFDGRVTLVVNIFTVD